MKIIIIFLFGFISLTFASQKTVIEEANVQRALDYLYRLPLQDQQLIKGIEKKLFNVEKGMVKIVENQEDIEAFVFVQGLDANYIPWYEVFDLALKANKASYFFNWSKFDSLEKNVKLLEVALVELQQKDQRPLTLIAYSAGGVVASLAMKESKNQKLSEIFFHTVASPVQGYGAPSLSKVSSPFFGSTTLEIGIGISKRLRGRKLSNCHNWVTTNCDLDIHACQNKDHSLPQRFDGSRVLFCEEEATLLDKQTHTTILPFVFRSVLNR